MLYVFLRNPILGCHWFQYNLKDDERDFTNQTKMEKLASSDVNVWLW